MKLIITDTSITISEFDTIIVEDQREGEPEVQVLTPQQETRIRQIFHQLWSEYIQVAMQEAKR